MPSPSLARILLLPRPIVPNLQTRADRTELLRRLSEELRDSYATRQGIGHLMPSPKCRKGLRAVLPPADLDVGQYRAAACVIASRSQVLQQGILVRRQLGDCLCWVAHFESEGVPCFLCRTQSCEVDHWSVHVLEEACLAKSGGMEAAAQQFVRQLGLPACGVCHEAVAA